MPRAVTTNNAQLIRAGEDALRKLLTNVTNARQQIMPVSLGLLAARREYPGDVEFGRWLQTSPYNDLGKDDRSCYIKIAENKKIAARVLRSPGSVSPEVIWKDEVKPELPLSENPTGEEEEAEALPSFDKFAEKLANTLRQVPSKGMKEKLDAVMQNRAELEPTARQELQTELDAVIKRFRAYSQRLASGRRRQPNAEPGRLSDASQS